MQQITNDLFDITKRLKDIDQNYVIIFNDESIRFEVHSSTYPSMQTLEFIVPFETLDERTLWYALKTRVENFESLQDEFDLHNKGIENKALESMNHVARQLSEMFTYAHQTSQDVAFSKPKVWL